MSGITLKLVGEATIPTPATDKATLFIDDATGEPSYKDDSGTVESLKGTAGTPGQGVPTGGTAGQLLAKIDGADYNTEWVTPSGGGAVDSVNGQTGVVQIDAEDVPYDNTASGLTATEVQAAIDELAAAPPGSGDVVGPASSVDSRVALFDGTTGKLLKDGGKTIAQIREIEQNSQSTAYTLVLTDAGKHMLHPSADTTPRTFTIPANSSVAYPIGTAITFVNQNAAGVLTIAITTDTMRLAGAGTTGSRTLAANGVATALKLTSTEWIISGTGLT